MLPAKLISIFERANGIAITRVSLFHLYRINAIYRIKNRPLRISVERTAEKSAGNPSSQSRLMKLLAGNKREQDR